MKKIIITLLTLFAVGVVTAGALAVRIYCNFSWLDESGLEEADVVFLEYDGVRYGCRDIDADAVSEWTDENLFRVGMDVNFPCGDTLKVMMDRDGTEWTYNLFGFDINITRLVGNETSVESHTVFEEVHGI